MAAALRLQPTMLRPTEDLSGGGHVMYSTSGRLAMHPPSDPLLTPYRPPPRLCPRNATERATTTSTDQIINKTD
eukprot:1188332-Prorocentrum_minimum.AAC.1